jgi:hypothetical protein
MRFDALGGSAIAAVTAFLFIAAACSGGASHDTVAPLVEGGSEASSAVDAPDDAPLDAGGGEADASPVDAGADVAVADAAADTSVKAATPTFTPPPGVYTSTQAVNIATTTPGASIHYTIDGSYPTMASAVYAGSVSITDHTLIRAMAVAPGFGESDVAEGEFTINCPPHAGVVLAPAGGVEPNDLVVMASYAAGAPVCYTLDGTQPSATDAGACASPSLTYDPAKGIALDGTVTGSPLQGEVVVTALAVAARCQLPPGTGTYEFQVAAPAIAPASGAIAAGTTVSFTSTTKGAVTFHYTTDGTAASCASPKAGASFVTTGTEAHVFVVGCKAGYRDSPASVASYTF